MFLLCWLGYFAAVVSRISFTASMAALITERGWGNAPVGFISTVFFISYGAGQLVSGYVGDRVPPKYMVGFGLLASAGANLTMGLLSTPGAMAVVWCCNGLIQSTLWTPILRIMSEDFPPDMRKKACVDMALTYPAACLLVYAGSAGLVAIGSWRWVFWAAAGLVAVVACVWLRLFARLDAVRAAAPLPQSEKAARASVARLRMPAVALVFICLALSMQGILRDGVTGWVPPYLSSVFGQGESFAILSATLLPVVNLVGVYVANLLYKRRGSETAIAAGLFGVATVAAVLLVAAGSRSYWLALLCFACVTSCMLGANVMLVSMVPSAFAALHRVSLVGGLTNTMVYLGSSVATWGFGAAIDAAGFGSMLRLLVAAGVCGTALCAVAVPFWRRFCRTVEGE